MPAAEACVAPEESISDQSSIQSSPAESSQSSHIPTELGTADQNPEPDEDGDVVPWGQAFSPDTDDRLKEDAHRIARQLPRAPGEESSLAEIIQTVREIIRKVRTRAPSLRAQIGMRPDGSVRVSTALKKTSNQAQTIHRSGPDRFQEIVATLALTFEQQPLQDTQGPTWTKTCPVEIILPSFISGFTDIDQRWRTEIIDRLRGLGLRDEQTLGVYNRTMLTYMVRTSHDRESWLRADLEIPNNSLLHLPVKMSVQRVDNDSEGDFTQSSDLPAPTYSISISYNCYHSKDGDVWAAAARPWECQLTVGKRTIVHSVVGSRPKSPNSLSALGTSSTSA